MERQQFQVITSQESSALFCIAASLLARNLDRYSFFLFLPSTEHSYHDIRRVLDTVFSASASHPQTACYAVLTWENYKDAVASLRGSVHGAWWMDGRRPRENKHCTLCTLASAGHVTGAVTSPALRTAHPPKNVMGTLTLVALLVLPD